jgi:chaperone modulatory protein CbpM
VFHEIDVARVELIVDIRRDFAVDDEAMELVLGLLDQIYGLRRQMRRLCEAVASQPPDVQDAIRIALPMRMKPHP